MDLSDFTYGVVLNSQTVKHAMVEVEQPALKKIVTIENKTNYLAMEYDPGESFISTVMDIFHHLKENF